MKLETWKERALEVFPEWGADMVPMDLIDLSCVLSRGVVVELDDGQHELAVRVARFAAWAWREGTTHEPLIHFAMDVLAESVRRENLRRELWRALPEDLFLRLLPAFCGILHCSKADGLEREYRHVMR